MRSVSKLKKQGDTELSTWWPDLPGEVTEPGRLVAIAWRSGDRVQHDRSQIQQLGRHGPWPWVTVHKRR